MHVKGYKMWVPLNQHLGWLNHESKALNSLVQLVYPHHLTRVKVHAPSEYLWLVFLYFNILLFCGTHMGA